MEVDSPTHPNFSSTKSLPDNASLLSEIGQYTFFNMFDILDLTKRDVAVERIPVCTYNLSIACTKARQFVGKSLHSYNHAT